MFKTNFGIKKCNINLIQTPQKSFGIKNDDNSKFSLVNINLDFLPKTFVITTNNGSYKFNIDILKNLSKTISDQLEKDPNNFEYHIDINDDENITKRFENILQGYTSQFKFSELLQIRQIIKILDIYNCPIYFKENLSITNYYQIPSNIEIEIEKISLINFLKTKYPQTFTIKTNKNVYKCTEIGILSSEVLRDLKNKNPEMTEFCYNFNSYARYLILIILI